MALTPSASAASMVLIGAAVVNEDQVIDDRTVELVHGELER